MKIDFAPVDVPVHRRLQTAAVLQWVYSFLGLGEYVYSVLGTEIMCKYVCAVLIALYY